LQNLIFHRPIPAIESGSITGFVESNSPLKGRSILQRRKIHVTGRQNGKHLPRSANLIESVDRLFQQAFEPGVSDSAPLHTAASAGATKIPGC
jgi:hypothetical protein